MEAPLSPLVCAVVAGESDGGGISDDRLRTELYSFLDKLGARDDVFLLPPDYTRVHSQAGKITQMISEYYRIIPSSGGGGSGGGGNGGSGGGGDGGSSGAGATAPPPSAFKIMPALGTHAPMTDSQIESMYGSELSKLHKNNNNNNNNNDPFLVHDWRNDVVTIGHVSGDMVRAATNGRVDKPWPAQLNKAVWEKRLDLHTTKEKKPLVLSIGQVVPHEVMGMANFNKNLFVGVGGLEAINLSHFIGAVYGMEKMMGRASNPLRAILNRASEDFLETNLDLWYILTVVSPTGALEGFFVGNTIKCYTLACELSMAVNFTLLDRSPSKMVVYLDPDEFHSTWLGNKSIYRTRLAIADGGTLIVLAPGIRRFGEDGAVDGLIRRYGYVGTPKIMGFLDDENDNENENDDTGGILANNLGAVAHLIHGSTEGRFRVVYCPGHLTREETEGVGFEYAPLDEMLKLYDPSKLTDGWHKNNNNNNNNDDDDDDEEFFYISNPALGLWAVPSRFEQ